MFDTSVNACSALLDAAGREADAPYVHCASVTPQMQYGHSAFNDFLPSVEIKIIEEVLLHQYRNASSPFVMGPNRFTPGGGFARSVSEVRPECSGALGHFGSKLTTLRGKGFLNA